MSDTPMIVETGNGFNGYNPLGTGWAAGLGGLILGTMWGNGGFGGFGGNGAGVNLANAVEHVSDQVTQGTISGLQSSQSTQNAINQQTIANMQSVSQLSDKVGGATFGIAQQIDQNGDQVTAAINQSVVEGMRNSQSTNDRLCAINNNITAQGYESRLQNQALAAQLQQQHADLSRQMYEENCKDRELMREIAAQAVRDQLTQAQNTIASQNAQINLTQQLQAQTMYLISQLGTTTSAAKVTTGS